MGLRVKDRRKSESLLVTSKIGLALVIATLAHVKTSRILRGAYYEKRVELLNGGEQMMA